MTDYKGIKTFDEFIEREHGKIGTDSRNEYEENATLFIVREMRGTLAVKLKDDIITIYNKP